MRRSALVFCLAVAMALVGCAQPRWYAPNVFSARLNVPYQLGAGDRVRVIVFGQDALSNSYSVDATGHISLPLIGPVEVHGMTTEQVERALEARFRNGFLRDPHVSVEVEAYRPFFVLGEVTNAGQYPYVNGMTVETAVAIAGGFTPRAAQWAADLTRVINGRQYTASVPMTEPVRPGDTILVRERLF
ncbi:MAG: polysaccharide export protein [Methylobacteriaceae bacterium]|nr:polysaccharide export protein [Methylobacteriaceae bacterium]MBV9244613.1 polysaccharide export protein [Methylobacteriaceae bacterium]MBV9633951.1 polysaccharide export protein [Methylobacteriaceae bacterium]MBV9702745.1 polysaccharide export protein [Methylobacteriaceae bacterium]